MRNLHKTVIGAFLAMALFITLPVNTLAQEVPDLSRNGSITLNLTCNGAIVTGGEFALWQVGDITENDGNYSFEKNDAFTDWTGAFDDLESSELATELAEYADSKAISSSASVYNADGTVTFTDVKPGLYLVRQVKASENFQGTAPFIISVPQNEDGTYVYDVNASPKIGTLVSPTPTNTPTATPVPSRTPDDDRLPQTGQLWWPVPVLVMAGLVFVIIGLLRRRRVNEKA